MKQHEEVIEIMEKNGGFATLAFLYQSVNVEGWKTKTPFASIRRIVQEERFFFRIKPGLWALNSRRNDVLKMFNIERLDNPKLVEEFNHTYYQGLLVELGNIEGYETFVPNQDKNRKYLTKPLKDFISLSEFYPFTYDHVIKRAKTIDVSWFNDRKYPSSFFEVEHSTDIHNSLLKFLELQDFHTKFNIVADKAREREFMEKINSTAYKPIKEKVNFLDYDKLSAYHSKAFELENIKKVVKL
ncbi:MAG TPA: hypothetical protein VI230_00570 [Ignavibacteriaceae bacterium]